MTELIHKIINLNIDFTNTLVVVTENKVRIKKR